MGVTVFFGLSFDMKNLDSISGKFIPEFVNWIFYFYESRIEVGSMKFPWIFLSVSFVSITGGIRWWSIWDGFLSYFILSWSFYECFLPNDPRRKWQF
jgi:hypothetical protein